MTLTSGLTLGLGLGLTPGVGDPLFPARSAWFFDNTAGTKYEDTDSLASNTTTLDCVFSVWVKFNPAGSSTDACDIFNIAHSDNFASPNPRFRCLRNSNKALRFTFDTQIDLVEYISANNVLPDNQWLHILAALDRTSASGIAGNQTFKVYVNGTKINNQLDFTNFSSNAINIANFYQFIQGADDSTNRPKMTYADLYYTNDYLDIDVAANREKWVVDGAPADLGSTGQNPTGLTPTVFMFGPNNKANLGLALDPSENDGVEVTENVGY